MSSMEHAGRLPAISVAKGGTLVEASLPLPYFEAALGYIVGRLVGIDLRELNGFDRTKGAFSMSRTPNAVPKYL